MNLGRVAEMMRRLKRLNEHDRWSREQLLGYQQDQVRQLREAAYARSAFYQRFHEGLREAPLAELPALDKVSFMDHWEEVCTDPGVRLTDLRQHLATLQPGQLFQGRYCLNATSGSTGQPGLFLYDPDEWLWMVMSFVRCNDWAGGSFRVTHRTKMASAVPTVTWHLWPRVNESLHNWWLPEIRFNVTDPVEGIVEALNRWQPELLSLFPSLGAKLAEEQSAGRLHINPQRIFTGAEALIPQWREEIEAVWGKCVYDHYGATEIGMVAAECQAHEGLHLQEDLFLAEVVDRDNRPVPDGELGDKVLVTVFGRRTVPLIRYEISDRVRVLPRPCPCGRPYRLIEIPGRMVDFIPVPAASGGMVTIHPNTIKGTMARIPVHAWQLQIDDGAYRLILAGLRGLEPTAVAGRLNDALAGEGAAPLRIDVTQVDNIPLGPTGKAVPIVLKKPEQTSAAVPA